MFVDFGGYKIKEQNDVTKYVEQISNNFSVLIVNEMFDESLVVLKNKLSWNWEDLVYQKMNVAKNSESQKSFTQQEKEAHRLFSPKDYLLYEESVKKLNKDMKTIENFSEQLSEFKLLNKNVSLFCNHVNTANQTDSQLLLTGVKFNCKGYFNFTTYDCEKVSRGINLYVQLHIAEKQEWI